MNHSPPPLPPPSCLRLGTLNVGLGFARKLPAILTRCTALALDVLALQEIGDPALLSSRLPGHVLIAAPGPSQHEAGVALLLSRDISPRCRAFLRSKSGRLVGAVLELNKGQRTLLVSAYMPSGLDHCSSSDPATLTAHALYAELNEWTRGCQCVVVLGDLNQTLTRFDRLPRPAAAPAAAMPSASTPINFLSDKLSGFTDVYRCLHPSAAHQPGFTHIIDTPLCQVRSRLDYIWIRGCSPSALMEVSIDTAAQLHRLSHHRLLWMQLRLDSTALHSPCDEPPLVMRLPNLRAATEKQQEKFALHLERQLAARVHSLQQLAHHGDAASLSSLASQLSSLALASARAELPVTGVGACQSKSVQSLERQRRDLTRLLRCAELLDQRCIPLAHCPALTQLLRHCIHAYQLSWSKDYACPLTTASWLAETRSLLRDTRSAIAGHKASMRRHQSSRFPVDSAAAVHRILRSDELPSLIHSVVDSSGNLTGSSDELKEVMANHFESVFALPPAPALQQPLPPAMLFDKPGVESHWYDGLMVDVQPEELQQLLQGVGLVSAPGEDQVSTGLWKLALQHKDSNSTRTLVCDLFTRCLRTSCFPASWKSGVIVPLLKDASKERTMSNIRPISLQSCLGKLLNQLLAHRLSAVIARHPILHPAQRGFVSGGTTVKCIDELLDSWQWSRGDHRSGSRELYTLLYDIKQAYDSVETPVLVRALQRIRLPAAFVALVEDSLTGLTSRVRTAFGFSRAFSLQRSIRQGDPLAPLLFAILMDALHDGLEQNPFTGQRHGLRMRWHHAAELYISSLGYADDTGALCNTLPDLRVQNDWVQYFLAFNRMRLNALKCELVGRRADGQSVTAADIAAAGITIDGHALEPVPHDQPIRYLGVHACFDGSWIAQQNKALSMIAVFTRAASKFRVPVATAVRMFNVFLMPKLELALHYVLGPGIGEWLKKCARLLVGCICHLAGSLLKLSHTAVALTLGLQLPAWLETSIKVSELFLRLNSSDPVWGQLGRIMHLNLCGPDTVTVPHSHPDARSQSVRAAYLAGRQLSWSLHLRQPDRARSRECHLLQTEPLAALPDPSKCSASSLVQLPQGAAPCHLVHDFWTGWGSSVAAPAASSVIDVFTDGSFDKATATSSWAVVIGNSWLESNHAALPTDERLLRSSDVLGAELLGASISVSQGVYAAELQAIARALAMLPLSSSLHIHSDSRASLVAVRSFLQQTNERKRLRMAARPLLLLIQRQLALREQAGGRVQWSHVKAHTDGNDRPSVGNRLADFKANLVRSHPARCTPVAVQQLPLSACEPFLHVLQESGQPLIDDPRGSSRRLQSARALAHWLSKPPGGQAELAGVGMIDLGRIVLSHGSPHLQCSLLHVATNSIHYYRHPSSPPTEPLQQLHCAACDCTLTILHLAECPEVSAVQFRRDLRDDVLRLLSASPAARPWLIAQGGCELLPLLLRLFPPSSPVPGAFAVPAANSTTRHAAFAMVGAFTAAAESAASLRIGLANAQEGRDLFRPVRLRCLAVLQRHFNSLKLSA